MKNEKLFYRLVLFLGLGISFAVVLLFKNVNRETAAAIASLCFLSFGAISFGVGRACKDLLLMGLSLGFLLFSVLPIGLLKYVVENQESLIPVFHKVGNFFFMSISILSFFRLIKMRLRQAKLN